MASAGSHSLEGEQHALLALILKENEHLQRENELLAAAFGDAKSDPAAAVDRPRQHGGGSGGGVGGGGSGDSHAAPTIAASEAGPADALTEDERSELVGQAFEAVEAALKKVQNAGDKDLEDIATLTEEVDLRLGELKKCTFDFKRDVLSADPGGIADKEQGGGSGGGIGGGCGGGSSEVDADKVMRFFESSISSKEALAEKLRARNGALKISVSKLEAQLAHEESMGEVLRQVDFDQLNIENQQHLETIHAKNQELLQMKKTAAKTMQALNDAKSLLASLEHDGDVLRREIEQRAVEQRKVETAQGKTTTEVHNARRSAKGPTETQQQNDTPLSMDYIRLKHEVAELQKQVADWQRKVEIRTM